MGASTPGKSDSAGRPPPTAGRAAEGATLSATIRLLVVAVIILPVIVMGLSAWVAWRDAWRVAASDLQHTADAVAEYGSRVLSAHAVAAGRVDAVLRGLSDDDIRAGEAALNAELKSLIAEVPQAEAAFVISRDGRPLVSANVFPVPRDMPVAADRDFFLALRADGAPAIHVSRVYTGRLDNTLFFAVSRRRTRTGNPGVPPGGFDGLVNISIYPNRVAEGLRSLVARDGDALALIRGDGEILARSIGQTGPVRIAPETRFGAAAAAGAERALFTARSATDGERQYIALRRIEGWPVYAAANRPRAMIIAGWWSTVWQQLMVGVPATLALLGLALLLRRGQQGLAAANLSLEARVAERTARLAESEAEFRAIFESTIIGMAQSDPRSGRLLRVNRRFCEILGHEEAELLDGTTLGSLTHPEDRAANEAGFRAAMAGGGRYEAETRYLRKDGEAVWVAVHVAIVRGAADSRPRAVVAVVDISGRKRSEAQRILLSREVDHRAKNALAVVQAALRLTPRTDAETYARAVEGRVAALARAHTLLAQAKWEGAGLHELAAGELATFLVPGEAGAGRVALDGPALRLSATAVQALSMTLHELATNAVKYGALGADTGRLRLTWACDAAAGLLRIRWEESGGPPISAPPARRGFGSRVIEATVRDQLGGEALRHWRPEGLACDITVPLARVSGEDADRLAAE
ncbi:PAS domain S-box protein [Paracraurococcus ruber]|uniref:histidine kinase n=1 Tax=Paracraurococcus ruber TaxID=77675 RepID=A0ABS1D0H6_9PROT|nr:PAS domain S-box protein [Paracraurococcus ruber]MBK1660308.1 hypothetical protein [Paracraurococcus ruber]TDG27755.1 PAS domain S-box protein [Paracraurococcus ruber]